MKLNVKTASNQD